jgi:hypothetical protein
MDVTEKLLRYIVSWIARATLRVVSSAKAAEMPTYRAYRC